MEGNALLTLHYGISMNNKIDMVASWYSSKEGFYGRLVKYGYLSIKEFFKGGTCLELGPADGRMTELILKDFSSVVSVDGSKKYCEYLRKMHNRQSFKSIHCLFEDFDTKTKFDTILATHVVEHLKNPIDVLKRSKDWIKSDGSLIIIVPNSQSIHRLAAVKMGLLKTPNELNDLDKKLGHYRIYNIDLLTNHIENAGWKISKVGGVFFKPISNQQIEEQWTTQMMDGFYELGKDFPEYCAEIFAVCILP